jgi:hypothetical protein
MHLNWTHENPSDSCWREFVRLHHPVNAVTPELIIPVPIAQGTSRTRSLEKDMTLDPANDAPQLKQQRDMLRSTTKMGLPPAHGEDSCKGSGQLKGRAVLSTGAATRNPDKGTSGRDLNDPILFYAERSFIAGAARQSLLLLLWLPFLLALPEAVPIVLLSALCFTLWQHSAFRFELTATHLWFRTGPFAPTILISLETIHVVEPVDYWEGLLTWRQPAAIGSLRLGFLDGSSITVTGIREPREAVGAVRLMREAALRV